MFAALNCNEIKIKDYMTFTFFNPLIEKQSYLYKKICISDINFLRDRLKDKSEMNDKNED